MSIPKVKIAVLKNLLIFDEKYLPQSVRLLEGGGVETLFGRIPFEHRFFLHGASLKSLNQSDLNTDVLLARWTHRRPLLLLAWSLTSWKYWWSHDHNHYDDQTILRQFTVYSTVWNYQMLFWFSTLVAEMVWKVWMDGLGQKATGTEDPASLPYVEVIYLSERDIMFTHGLIFLLKFWKEEI